MQTQKRCRERWPPLGNMHTACMPVDDTALCLRAFSLFVCCNSVPVLSLTSRITAESSCPWKKGQHAELKENVLFYLALLGSVCQHCSTASRSMSSMLTRGPVVLTLLGHQEGCACYAAVNKGRLPSPCVDWQFLQRGIPFAPVGATFSAMAGCSSSGSANMQHTSGGAWTVGCRCIICLECSSASSISI